MQVTVTKDDIRKGVRSSCSQCPIALAVLRKFPHDPFPRVNVGLSITWGYPNTVGYRRWKLTKAAEDFIRNFDTGEPVSPFTFTARRLP